MAATVRPGRSGIGRSTSAATERVSDDLRRGAGDFLEQRRQIAGLTSLAALALGVVGLYQFGLLRRVPEPPLPGLGASEVDAAGGVYLFAEQVAKHGKICSWCTVAAAAQVATLPLALPEARAALRQLTGRG